MEIEGGVRWTMEGLMIWRQDSHNAAGVCIDSNLQLRKVNSPEHGQEKVQARRGVEGVVEGRGGERGMTTHSLLTWSRPPPVMPRHLTVTLYCLTVQTRGVVKYGAVSRTTMNWTDSWMDYLKYLYRTGDEQVEM